MAQAEREKPTKTRSPTAERSRPAPRWHFPRIIGALPRWVFWTGGGILVLIATFIVALYFLDWNALRGPIGRYASHRIGREVRIAGDLHVKIFSWQPRVDANRIWIANPQWLGSRPAADIEHLTFEFRLLPLLLGGRWILPLVDIEHASVDVVREADGRTNWRSSKSSRGWDIPPIRRFILNDGRVSIDDRERHLIFNGTISSRETAGATPDRAFQLVGSGTLNRKPFTADVHGGALIHVDESRPYRFTGNIHAGATHVVIDGEITRPFHLGQYSTNATITGRNLSDLYDLTELALPGTPPYRISGALVRDGSLYRFEHFSGTVGDSDLHGSLSVDVSGDVPFIRGAVVSRTLAFVDLGALIGNERRSEAMQSRSDGLLPDTPLRVQRLRRTNAEIDYSADDVKSRDFPLRGLATHISLESGVLLLKPLAFDFPRGRIAGFIKIDARRPTAATTLDARVSGARIEQFFHSTEKTISGLLAARAVLKGEGNSVRDAALSADGAFTLVVPEGRIRQSIAEWLGVNVISALGLTLSGNASDTGLRCAIAHFGAHNGILTAQKLMFDTDPVLVTGSGAIDLRREAINIAVAGKPKSFQLMRLNLPVTVTGALAHPTLGVKPGPAVMQAGFAIALGFLTPAAAILPFVDAGLAKNANCGALVVQAATQSAPVRVRRH
jgi:hypothetical protein